MSHNEVTPGRLALEEMKIVHKDLEVFKRPNLLPVSKKRKQVVLDEDSYVEEIGKIIQRDFFPSLEKLKAQNNYLDAVERNDVIKLQELYTKYSGKKPPPRAPSPATFETPANIHNLPTNPAVEETQPFIENKQKTGPKLSLDQFLNSHTSEDNESFIEILEEADKKHKLKYSYLINEEGKSEEEQRKLLTLPTIEEQAMLPEKKLNVDTWGYKNRNFIMYIPDGVELTDEKCKDINEKRLQVNYDNTRLQVNPFDENQNKSTISELAKAQSKVLDGKIGVDGKELVKESPKICGYSFIRDPSPCPEVMASPLMTWGMIEGTPFRLDGGDTPLPKSSGPSFKMAEPPRREQIALELAEKAAEKDRNKRKKAMDAAKRLASPSPRVYSTVDRLATMSPAARRLATCNLKLGISTPLRSPKPGSTTPRLGRKTPKRAITPMIKSPRISSASEENLTDDLLKINVPKRLTAADFF